ncbi:hypothetical protein LCGC14_0259130 [marine sediment metagenome]|uniref:Uncharacterized protein n=1 Tax=marine sediment metagenome TaxID=412755 RepID=A0A0F9X7A6_9ZZZZ
MTTALAIRPTPPVIEFRRCTGHCCDPVTIQAGPYYHLRRVFDGMVGDVEWIADNLIYVGWRSPANGGWVERGNHEYSCPHFDKRDRRCLIYGQGKRSLMCRTHPNYGRGPWKVCLHEGCTRRTMVLDMNTRGMPRWLFPDLWNEDWDRWVAFEEDVCRPEWGADAMPPGHDE